MNKIPSFTIDHNRLLRGIYVSRRDTTPSGDVITTFDVRMTEPNRQPALTPESLHALEHLAATYLRNNPHWKDRIVYWGPMGCCTGNYLIVQGELESADVVDLLRDTMDFVANFEGEVPGASPRDCGNWSFMDLEQARKDARRYLHEVLADIKPENLVYPQ
ncbi:S-ribosylhomocysteine lyase [uncultured Duncaniella sp.]|uniref:S-ribosylhomocysteine lyase n=1 Tax=uncultured Duncaniella sp. TaxID=2768039 RepID=UPI0025D51DA6|nr:S-ribosylhomocysteine lyase [uncultured Duncaniella sp.]